MQDPDAENVEEKVELVGDYRQEGGLNAKRVATGAILGALSIAVTPIAEVLPRLPWGIAIFDPVSFFWLIAFLVGGIWVGLISIVAGTMTLFLFDPTAIGPFYKFAATLPFMIVPYVAVRFRGSDGASLADPNRYLLLMIIAYVMRIAMMVPLNLVTIPLVMPFIDPASILPYTVILNTNQSIWDALVPYFVVHMTPIFRNYKLW
jgi:hypothetical protein